MPSTPRERVCGLTSVAFSILDSSLDADHVDLPRVHNNPPRPPTEMAANPDDGVTPDRRSCVFDKDSTVEIPLVSVQLRRLRSISPNQHLGDPSRALRTTYERGDEFHSDQHTHCNGTMPVSWLSAREVRQPSLLSDTSAT